MDKMKIIERKKSAIGLIIIMFAAFYHQAGYVLGINGSLSDILLLVISLHLIINKNYFLPKYVLIYFLILSISTIFTASFITPTLFNIIVDHRKIFIDLTKMGVSLMYLLIGYNLGGFRKLNYFFKGYSIAGIIIGGFGIFLTVSGVTFFDNYLFFPGGRYDGLMADPNYYAVLMSATIPYFYSNKKIKLPYKIMLFLVILTSILISGSKTGTIVYLLFIGFMLQMSIFKTKSYLKKIVIVLLLISTLFVIAHYFSSILDFISLRIPIFERISIVFSDFNSAISQEGSSRNYVYETAIRIIKKSPFIGIGVGTYSDVAMSLSGSRVIAHNTYLQIFSEWGVILSMILLSYLAYIIIYISKKYKNKNEVKIAIQMILVLLLGSLAISLNNARLFWFIYGVLLFFKDRLMYKTSKGELE